MAEDIEASEVETWLRQARRLEIAYAVLNVIHGYEIDGVLERVAETLVEVGGFSAAHITVKVTREHIALEQTARYGTSTASGPLSVPLVAHAETLGQLDVWLAPESDLDASQELLDYVVPTLATALDDSIGFIELNRWREALERKVEERTAELKTANEKLVESFEALARVKAARDRIFANINHEIRTPLSLVVLATDDLRKGGAGILPEAARHRLDGIDSNVRRVLQLVDGLLLLAAGDEGKLQIRPMESDLALVLIRLVSMWAVPARQAGIELSWSGPESCRGTFDETAIERVVANLLSNAVKFTPKGGAIGVELEAGSDEHVIRVRDTGLGIDESFGQRLFGRFEQGPAAVNKIAWGSGIGLSIVKELAEAHGGRIHVEANPGGGSVFVLVLPVRARGVAVSVEHGPRVAGLLPDGGHVILPDLPRSEGSQVYAVECKQEPAATVLVAEDNPALAAEVAAVLAEEYRVIVAPDGLAALEVAREKAPDLLVTDVQMPRMNGYELTREFLSLPSLRLSPVILLTSRTELKDRMTGFGAGAVDHIEKPFEPDDLKARVRSQLAMRRMALRLHESENLAAIGVLSAGLAHELRNPANGVLNAIGPLKELLPPECTSPGTATAELLEVIETCARQLSVVTRQLLGLARGGGAATGDEHVAVSADTLIKQAMGVLAKELRNVDLRVYLAKDLTLVCVPAMILQVLTHLLDNASQAAGEGGTVQVSGRAEGERVLLRISDSGAGVPPALRARIFDPFFTTKPPGIGTGLGLPTARRIIEQHEGTLTLADSSVGATFVIDLPRRGPRHFERTRSPVR